MTPAPSANSGPRADPPWYVAAFKDEYRSVYAHRDLAAARREVAWVAEAVLGDVRGPVLDLCCGFGRHSLALRERGLNVVGMDLSSDLLVAAAGLPGASRHLRGRLARGDMRRLPFATGSLCAVVNLFTSFGYLGAEGDGAALDEIARVLAPGGRLVMDLMNPATIRAGFRPYTREERDGVVIEGRRELHDSGRRVTKDVTWRMPDGGVRTWREDVRMFEPDELDALLASRGIEVAKRVGGFEGGDFGPDSDRQIVVARRAL